MRPSIILHAIAKRFGVHLTYSCHILSDKVTRDARGRTLWSTDNPSEAKRWWRNAYRMAPSHEGTYYLRADAVLGTAVKGRSANPASDTQDLPFPQVLPGVAATPEGGTPVAHAAEAAHHDGAGTSAGGNVHEQAAGSEPDTRPLERVKPRPKVDLNKLGA